MMAANVRDHRGYDRVHGRVHGPASGNGNDRVRHVNDRAQTLTVPSGMLLHGSDRGRAVKWSPSAVTLKPSQ